MRVTMGVKEASNHLGISERDLFELIKRREIRCEYIPVGEGADEFQKVRVRFDKADILHWLDVRTGKKADMVSTQGVIDAMAALGMGNKEFAELIGVKSLTVTHWIKGEQYPSPLCSRKILDAAKKCECGSAKKIVSTWKISSPIRNAMADRIRKKYPMLEKAIVAAGFKSMRSFDGVAGVRIRTIQHWQKGECLPTKLIADRLADYLNVPVKNIFHDYDRFADVPKHYNKAS